MEESYAAGSYGFDRRVPGENLQPGALAFWKGEWRAKVSWLFPAMVAARSRNWDADQIAQLERKIGQQAMEIEFLKKAVRRSSSSEA